MSLYNEVYSIIDNLEIGELVSIPIPKKIKSFRKFLSEIAAKDRKKFTTKVSNGYLHIMRIKYYSVTEKLSND